MTSESRLSTAVDRSWCGLTIKVVLLFAKSLDGVWCSRLVSSEPSLSWHYSLSETPPDWMSEFE